MGFSQPNASYSRLYLGVDDRYSLPRMMVVDHVGKVVGGHAVGFDQNLVVQLAVFHFNVAINHIFKAGRALARHFLADDIGHTGGKVLCDLPGRQVAAMAVVVGRLAAGFLDGAHFVQPLLVAKAVIRVAAFDQLFCVVKVHAHALALNIRAVAAVFVGAFVPEKPGFAQRAINNVHRALNIPFLVGVLNAQHKGAAAAFCL